MSQPVTIAIVLALLAPAGRALGASGEALDVSPGRYVLDSRSASLEIRLFNVAGLPPSTLRVTKLDGRFRYDPAEWRRSNVVIDADPASVVASRGYVAHHAKTMFEPQKYPTIAFTSTALKWTDAGRGVAEGELTFHGVTRPVTLQVVLQDAGGTAAGADERLRFSGRGKVRRSEFGIHDGFPFVRDAVDLVFDMEFVKQPPAEASR